LTSREEYSGICGSSAAVLFAADFLLEAGSTVRFIDLTYIVSQGPSVRKGSQTANIHQPGSNSYTIIRDFAVSTVSTAVPFENVRPNSTIP
jgi:hypothetical protein